MRHSLIKHCFKFLAIVSAALLACGAVAAAEPQYGGEYRALLGDNPVSLDPARYSDVHSVTVANNLFDGLVEFDQHLGVRPAVATFWKISRDHRTYTFHLRDDVRFHNGRQVTAADFVYSFTRLLDPEVGSPATSYTLARG